MINSERESYLFFRSDSQLIDLDKVPIDSDEIAEIESLSDKSYDVKKLEQEYF